MGFDRNVSLAEHTTIRLGGPASHFVTVTSVDQIRTCLRRAAENRWPAQILGGGSNIIFSDEGFNGLIIKIGLSGMDYSEKGTEGFLRVGAGENWDDVVRFAIEKGATGLECLSGIPGLAGAVPVQNVGAYGQEVRETIISVKVLDRTTLEEEEFSNDACDFSYRQSRFKQGDRDKFIITEVLFRLRPNGKPEIHYDELRRHIENESQNILDQKGPRSLAAIRASVLALRKRKSMLIDFTDPHSRSCGSFFMNPVLNNEEFQSLQYRMNKKDIPHFPAENGVKVPAAWLVELAGFHKGYRAGSVGVSANHSLALVNYGGTTMELLALANAIQRKVQEEFSVSLEREPVIVP
jgi:UDP-N-acetylmuramate dehydrogenase